MTGTTQVQAGVKAEKRDFRKEVTDLSTPVENCPFRRSKIPPPHRLPAGAGSRFPISVLSLILGIHCTERSRARRFCAAQQTLDGEDRSAKFLRRERALVQRQVFHHR